MAQIINITSEALQAQIRELLPSQQGFGEDLQASNVILPIIDLTPAAEGSGLRADLQTAWDFATSHNEVNNATTNIVTTPGFYKVELNAAAKIGSGVTELGRLYITTGLGNAVIWQLSEAAATAAEYGTAVSNTMTVFLRSGDTLVAQSDNLDVTLNVWTRQIADLYGNLVNPLDYAPQ